jgi:ribosomal protein L11 methyltransferase
MDAGCGTAILSIMAAKLGARQVEAFDIDEWSAINGQENIENNGCPNIHLMQGTIADMKFEGKFDVLLANINKNVLLAEMNSYANYLSPGGQLLLSGFYTKDVEDLKLEAAKYGLSTISNDERETWAALLLIKL